MSQLVYIAGRKVVGMQTPRQTSPSGTSFDLVVAAVVLSVLLGAVVGGVLGAVQSAEAHDTPSNCVGVYYIGTQRGVACTQYSHGVLDACDRRADGLYARAWTVLSGGFVTWGAWDGSSSGCAHDDLYGDLGQRSSQHRICVEQPVGCSYYVRS